MLGKMEQYNTDILQLVKTSWKSAMEMNIPHKPTTNLIEHLSRYSYMIPTIFTSEMVRFWQCEQYGVLDTMSSHSPNAMR